MDYYLNGKRFSVFGPCTCGGCADCYPAQFDTEDEVYCLTCLEETTPHQNECSKCHETYQTLWGVFALDGTFLWNFDSDDREGALKSYLLESGRKYDDDQLSGMLDQYVFLRMQSVPSWFDLELDVPFGSVKKYVLGDVPPSFKPAA